MNKMKKVFAILLCFITIFGTICNAAEPSSITTAKEYELWTQSPSITSGITNDELTIYKAMKAKTLYMYELPEIGDKYYLAICESKMTDGGYSGNKDTSYYYTYMLYETEDSFIILSKASFTGNEYYWTRGVDFANLNGAIDKAYYQRSGYEVPLYIYSMNGKYRNTNYDEYVEYAVITDKGNLYKLSYNDEYGCAGYPFLYNKKLYIGETKYRSNNRVYNYEVDGADATSMKELRLKNGSISYGSAMKIVTETLTSNATYKSYHEDEDIVDKVSESFYSIPGSDQLFYKYNLEKTYDSAAKKNYYYVKVTVMKSVNGKMQTHSSALLPTTLTSASSSVDIKIINELDQTYYKNSSTTPSVLIGKYGVILKNGTVCPLKLDANKYYDDYYDFCIYNGRFAVNRFRTKSGYDYRADPDSTSTTKYYWQNVNYINFNTQGRVTLSSDMSFKISSTPPENLKGYYTSRSSSNFKGSVFTTASEAGVQEWWGRQKTNIFPDGRYVEMEWMGIGSGSYELWYNIYNPNGTLRSTGPTGYSRSFGTTWIEDSPYYHTLCIAINNSKFVVALASLEKNWSVEYYRVAVVAESETGEVGSNVELGEKDIIPPDDADTEVIQSTIDFGENELPIGFNIKDNVVDSNNLETDLREQVNAIRLNDIVILMNDNYQSGVLNTGVSLNTFSQYDYSMGSTYIRVYSNGQNFCWYCNSPGSLKEGEYNKTYYIGNKTIYVKFIVIKPPSNDGSTTVVF